MRNSFGRGARARASLPRAPRARLLKRAHALWMPVHVSCAIANRRVKGCWQLETGRVRWLVALLRHSVLHSVCFWPGLQGLPCTWSLYVVHVGCRGDPVLNLLSTTAYRCHVLRAGAVPVAALPLAACGSRPARRGARGPRGASRRAPRR